MIILFLSVVLFLIILIMNTAHNTPVEATEAPNAQPQAGVLKGLTTKIVTALAALGIATSVTENAEGATILLGTLPASQTNTLRANPTQHIEGLSSSTFHISYEDGKNGWTFTVGLNYQIDCTGTTTTVGRAVDLNTIIQREFTWLQTVELVNTSDIPEGISGVTLNLTDSFDQSGILQDSWSINPVTNPAGIDVTIGYRSIIDSKYASSTVRFANDTYGNISTPIEVNFTPISVPEPDLGLLTGAGLVLTWLLRRRRGNTETTNTSVK